MTTTETTELEELNERLLANLRQMVANKREADRQAIEDYKNNPELQALIAELDRKNAERETPITQLGVYPR